MTPLILARSPPVEATGQGHLCLSWVTGECGLIACRCLRLTLRSDHPALDLKVDTGVVGSIRSGICAVDWLWAGCDGLRQPIQSGQSECIDMDPTLISSCFSIN